MPDDDEVVLRKAPQPGQDGARELVDGFDAQTYPGLGPFFASVEDAADQVQKAYQNGMQEIRLPADQFQDLVHRGIVCPDPLSPAGTAWHVPADGLPELNAIVQKFGRCT